MFKELNWTGRERFLMLLSKPFVLSRVKQQTETNCAITKYLNYTLTVERRAPKTYDNRKNILEPFFKKLDIDTLESITLDDINAAFSARSFQIEVSTYSQERQIVRSFFAYCAEIRSIKLQFDYHKITRIKAKYAKRTIPTTEQIEAACTQAKEYQDRLMIASIAQTGLRIGELTDLELKDIHGKRIDVRGKGSKDRVVYMPACLANEIHNHCLGKTNNDKVFLPLQKHHNHNNDRYTVEGARRRIQEAFKRVGCKVNPHDLRHYFAVQWILKGGDLRSLQLLMGHDSIETTQIYLQFTDKQVQDNYDQIYQNALDFLV